MRYLFVVLLSLLLSGAVHSQVHQHAIGFRAGGERYYSYGPELSYQLGTSDMNRIEFDLGWYHRNDWNNGKGWGSGHAYNLTAFSIMYHWDWNLTDGLNWYIGPGGQLVYYNERYYNYNDGIYLGLGFQVGLEYDFTDLGAPLLLGLDARPMFMFSWYNGVGGGGALSLRYLIN